MPHSESSTFFGIVLIEHLPHVPPQPLDARALGVVLDEGGRHIHAESVATHVHPEAHDVLHRLERRPGCGMFGRELPGLRPLLEAVVERGLRAEEVDHVIAVAVAHAAHPAVMLGIDKDVGRPDIAGGIPRSPPPPSSAGTTGAGRTYAPARGRTGPSSRGGAPLQRGALRPRWCRSGERSFYSRSRRIPHP